MASSLNYGTITASRPLRKEEAFNINMIAGCSAAETGSTDIVFEQYYENDMFEVLEKITDTLLKNGVTTDGEVLNISSFDGQESVLYVESGTVRWEEKHTITEFSDDEIRAEYEKRFGKESA